MLKNYLTIIFRNFKRERLHSALNLLGLMTGLTAFMLIALFVRTELSYDQFHSQKNSLYRIIQVDKETGARRGVIPPTLAAQFEADIPGIQGFNRLTNDKGRNLVQLGEEGIYTEGFYYTDEDFFDLFDFKLTEGGSNLLADQGYAVLTRSFAMKLFGDANPIGKELSLNKEKKLVVSGICENPPHNSTLQFDILAKAPVGQFENTIQQGYLRSVVSYLHLDENADMTGITQQLNDSNAAGEYKMFFPNISFELLPVTDQHLRSGLDRDVFNVSDIRMVYLFSGIGLTILLLAIINYINMVIARSLRRAKEIGLRKVIGAQKRDLVGFQLLESVLMTTISLILAFALAERIVPLLNDQFEMGLYLNYLSVEFLVFVPFTGIGLGLLSGLYPAWYINRYSSLLLLRSSGKGIGDKNWLRKILVGFQFAVAGIMLLVTIIMQSQMQFMKNKEIGFDKDLLVQIPLFEELKGSSQTFKNETLGMAGVSSATVANWMIGRHTSSSRFSEKVDRDSRERPPYTPVTVLNGDKDMVKTLGVSVLEMEADFDLTELDTTHTIISKAAAQALGWEGEALGKTLYEYGGDKRRVVAVIEDFHSNSYKEEMAPTVIEVGKIWSDENLLIRFSADKHQETLAAIGELYEQIVQRPFEFTYLDDEIDKFYRKEAGQVSLFNTFSTLAIALSLMGLIAMASYATRQRQKEVSVRKVLGASVKELILMLNKEQTRLTIIAFLIATPIVVYAMQDWLATFKYRISIDPLYFVLAIAGFIALNLITTLVYTLRVSRANPAETLRNE
ncbi:MAG: ABC transporter permease [Roseivirga sp.]